MYEVRELYSRCEELTKILQKIVTAHKELNAVIESQINFHGGRTTNSPVADPRYHPTPTNPFELEQAQIRAINKCEKLILDTMAHDLNKYMTPFFDQPEDQYHPRFHPSLNTFLDESDSHIPYRDAEQIKPKIEELCNAITYQKDALIDTLERLAACNSDVRVDNEFMEPQLSHPY